MQEAIDWLTRAREDGGNLKLGLAETFSRMADIPKALPDREKALGYRNAEATQWS
jgi:hypothetical protein